MFNFSSLEGHNFSFIKSILSGPDGGASLTRVVLLMLISFIIGVGVALVAKVHQPISVEEFDAFLSSAAAFISITCAPLYLINKGAEVLNKNSPAQG